MFFFFIFIPTEDGPIKTNKTFKHLIIWSLNVPGKYLLPTLGGEYFIQKKKASKHTGNFTGQHTTGC